MRRNGSKGPLDKAWEAYRETGSDEARNYLITQYIGTVKCSAERISLKLPKSAPSYHELMSFGIDGLLDAINSFDPEKGAKFETFSEKRINGAIMDGLRDLDHVPRLARTRKKKYNEAHDALMAENGESPTDEELREKLGLSPKDYKLLIKGCMIKKKVALAAPSQGYRSGQLDKEEGLDQELKCKRELTPYEAASRKDLTKFITFGLQRAERLVLVLRYYEQMTMEEIGVTLDVSESRVSKMHASILNKLRERFTEPQDREHLESLLLAN